ncbi:MAG TPA: SUMF1/EgtB/PvdO family nonheme iron enzyme, partial [Phycisphaerae bacterium]|nr:SUMF1/EgtB/PvdO family nonheme iron enzyme [Phycisphaerae bacterium]
AAVIDLVPVGDPGNAADTRYGNWGAVGHKYWMGKFEVTNGQYIEFLNAAARISDPYSLYLHSPTWSGIVRTGSPGNYTYGPKNGDAAWLNRPAIYVTYWSALRFANWLHNGQPTGPPGPSTTEDGAYTLNGYFGPDGRSITRKPGARWAIPTEDEWYKAAYYKGGSTNAGYWDYPTRSNTAPTCVVPPGAAEPPGSANYRGSTADPVYRSTPVGAYTYSPGPYGTFDQGGNVTEWTETLAAPVSGAWPRVYRGGMWVFNTALYLHASQSLSLPPGTGWTGGGFRVVYVPEPATAALATLGGLALIRRRQKLSLMRRKLRLRHQAEHSTGVGMDWIRLEDVTGK